MHSLSKRFGFETKIKLFISLYCIRARLVTHTPTFPIVLFGKITMSIVLMENETKEVIKMQKLKKTQQNKQLTFETYEHALFSDPDGVTNENKSNEMK